ncbi:DUF222 domain-containing protein [Tessaracoccus sp. MC1865]|uniref:HNH endonuclease signature motif containing protein n=1 Tax=Tessaracoccus sp. MC1865 TaxID=2760310 RepID=UPI0016022996|nr:HNH endonuclease signature motif containing protein [Tessaracoccus sp. MC1865]MBB1484110.1 DUF222 domain-containing protein [Tessaracoccus sp. MC1865]QTO37139.1 DUF222 domain-containing protein [Tessaracoccus sp. MC1865]
MSEARELMQQGIAALWDAVGSLRTDSPAAERLATMVHTVTEAEAQLAGLRLHLLHEARLSAADSVVDEVRQSVRTTTAQATASLKLALDLGERFPLIAAALNDGEISLAQAEAIISGLRKLPGRLTRADLVECQKSVLEHVDTLGPSELRELASRLAEVIDPDLAEADDAKRLAAEERAARRGRFLRLSPDHHGSIRITGLLPVADAALLAAQLEALLPSASSYADAGETPGPDVRRADALVLLAQAAAAAGDLPAHGGDRPRVHITMHLDTLTTGLGAVGLPGLDVDGLAPGAARRMACDAGVIPMVLGSDSQPLDVGREHRLFTPAIRAALMLRDGGCAFPHCTATPASCDAHHIVPWWAGGGSSLANGVLLCPHHHRLVEPDPQQSPESQWQVHLDQVTGMPWFTPPRHVDPARRPRQHPRHLMRELTPSAKAPPRPDESEPPDFSRLEELIARTAVVWQPAS